jgi:hypothetical protein
MSSRFRGLAAGVDPANVVWIATVIAIILAGMFIAWIVLKWLFGSSRRKDGSANPAFSSEQLRHWRHDGTITEAEYKILMEKILRGAGK